ncbi:hypothetical protein ABTY59_19315 [Streptomyces sp. NPDC096079]|uniref:hypothetical protein n=1 Tax=Streptomyces sp. NPDC096079 TaxID=3155820 RepID=UPI00332E6413
MTALAAAVLRLSWIRRSSMAGGWAADAVSTDLVTRFLEGRTDYVTLRVPM